MNLGKIVKRVSNKGENTNNVFCKGAASSFGVFARQCSGVICNVSADDYQSNQPFCKLLPVDCK